MNTCVSSKGTTSYSLSRLRQCISRENIVSLRVFTNHMIDVIKTDRCFWKASRDESFNERSFSSLSRSKQGFKMKGSGERLYLHIPKHMKNDSQA